MSRCAENLDLDLHIDLVKELFGRNMFEWSAMKKAFINYLNMFITVFGTYLVWICIHYAASHLYITYCVPGTILGFLMAPFVAIMPHCQALRWTIYYGGGSINAMWIIFGLWLSKYLKPITI